MASIELYIVSYMEVLMYRKFCCSIIFLCAISASLYVKPAFSDVYEQCDIEEDDYSWEKPREKVAQPKYYISAGVSFPAYLEIDKRYKGDPNNGIALAKPQKHPFYSAAAGMRSSFNDQVAFEVEGMFYKGKSKIAGYSHDFVKFSADIDSFSLFLNSYYMFDGFAGFHPFFGLGAGVSHNSITNSILTPATGQPLMQKDDTKWGPAFQVILGINKQLSQNVDIQAKLKAMSLGKFSGEGSEGRFKAVTISGDVGLKYSLDKLKNVKK